MNSTKVKGKVLVCRQDDDSTESKLAKAEVVKEAGGVGMILIDDADKDVAIPFKIPSAIVGRVTGDKILSYINHTRFVLQFKMKTSVSSFQVSLYSSFRSFFLLNSNPTSKILRAKTVLGSQPAPRVAAFSSKGPNSLTPEILKVN